MENDAFLFALAQVCEDCAALDIPNDGANGYMDDQRLAVLAGAERSLSRRAVFRAIKALELEVQQRGHVRIGVEHEVPAASAVAAVRPALRDVFFPMEGCVTVPAVAGFNDDFRMINKLHDFT